MVDLGPLLVRWREDPGGTYRRWFRWEKRLKNAGSIRACLVEVLREIDRGTFGRSYAGSSLEAAARAIGEQRRLFRGAERAFRWDPRRRSPDIYADRGNRRAFGCLLDECLRCSAGTELESAIRALETRHIKGYEPGLANALYFLRPTLAPPFHVAVVDGYNVLTGESLGVGWEDYLSMRRGMLELTSEYRELLSDDLGALAGLLFDVGSHRYPAPPQSDQSVGASAWRVAIERAEEEPQARLAEFDAEREGDLAHTTIQGWLRDLGIALGYDVWVATNDRNRPYGDGLLGDKCLAVLPETVARAHGADVVASTDVLWLERFHVAAAFEVEQSSSIFSGAVRLFDLAIHAPVSSVRGLFVVAPTSRKIEVTTLLRRPTFARVRDLDLRFLAFGDLERHRAEWAGSGEGVRALDAFVRALR